jgi:hypothetical protein
MIGWIVATNACRTTGMMASAKAVMAFGFMTAA